MGTQQLREIYGGNSRQAMARAIRAEIPDGQAILDQQQRAQMWIDHISPVADQETRVKAAQAWQRAHARRVAAENTIRAKYEMPIRGDEIALLPVF